MVGQSKPAEPYCLDACSSTTRIVVNSPPTVYQEPDCKFQFLLQLPEGEGRQGTGGLRTNGIYKRSLPDKPLITVITVVFNGVSTIEDTIQSVLSQTYNNVEYIVIDGGSTDGTQEIVRKYEHAIDYWVSEKDKGIYDAMNKGIALATGDIIGFLNADDVFAHRDVLREYAEGFQDINVDACYGDVVYVSQENQNRVVRFWKSSPYSCGAFGRGWVPPHPTFYVRRGVYNIHGCFNQSMPLAADFEIMCRFIHTAVVKTKYLPGIKVKMKLGGETNRSIGNIIKGNAEMIRAMRQHGVPLGLRYFFGKAYLRMSQFINRLPIK